MRSIWNSISSLPSLPSLCISIFRSPASRPKSSSALTSSTLTSSVSIVFSVAYVLGYKICTAPLSIWRSNRMFFFWYLASYFIPLPMGSIIPIALLGYGLFQDRTTVWYMFCVAREICDLTIDMYNIVARHGPRHVLNLLRIRMSS